LKTARRYIERGRKGGRRGKMKERQDNRDRGELEERECGAEL